MGRVNQCQIAFDISIKLHTITSCHSCCGCFIPHYKNSLNKFKITYNFTLIVLNNLILFHAFFLALKKVIMDEIFFALISEQKNRISVQSFGTIPILLTRSQIKQCIFKIAVLGSKMIFIL